MRSGLVADKSVLVDFLREIRDMFNRLLTRILRGDNLESWSILFLKIQPEYRIMLYSGESRLIR